MVCFSSNIFTTYHAVSNFLCYSKDLFVHTSNKVVDECLLPLTLVWYIFSWA